MLGRISRRIFLSRSLYAGTALTATESLARTLSQDYPWLPGAADQPRAYPDARYLTAAERRCVDAITARLIPSDAEGPGAREAGVADFIDSQLAGFYGRGERWYMRGPFAQGSDEQGYQAELPPAGLYRKAIEALDAHCRDRFGDRAFADLTEEEQDALLGRMEEGALELDSVGAKGFFSLVRENAIEGFFCDPIYGGNRDMTGWKLVGFPGARYDYRDFLDHDGERINLEPVGLNGRPAWDPA